MVGLVVVELFFGEVWESASAIVVANSFFVIVGPSSTASCSFFCFCDDVSSCSFFGEVGVFEGKKSVICFAGDCCELGFMYAGITGAGVIGCCCDAAIDRVGVEVLSFISSIRSHREKRFFEYHSLLF